jgi:membrane-bound metal-dependent hydrolase YbcI (DUF457 family)
MFLEHWIYSIAIAIIVGAIYHKYTGKDHSWIIIASAFAPDIDLFINYFFRNFGITLLINGNPIQHGNFHNLAIMLFFTFLTALLLQTIGLRFRESFLFASIGFMAHMFEDALIANPAYAFFWPLSAEKFGIGLFAYNRDLYGIANTQVLIVGLLLVIMLAIVRSKYEINDWITCMVIPNPLLTFCVNVCDKTHEWIEGWGRKPEIVPTHEE